MKHYLVTLILVCMSIYACTGEKAKQINKEEAKPERISKEKLLVLPWKAEYNPQLQKLQLKHVAPSVVSNLTVRDMIDAVNIKYPEIQLQSKGKTSDTLLVFISDASKLTDESGSAGAQSFLAEVTFSLTELKGIEAVHFDFKEGEHAVSKTYSRKDFEDFN